jgi:hypothetical protein
MVLSYIRRGVIKGISYKKDKMLQTDKDVWDCALTSFALEISLYFRAVFHLVQPVDQR